MKEEEFTPIGGEVQEQLDLARARAQGSVPPDEDPGNRPVLVELPDDDTESILFNHQNEGFGPDIEVDIGKYRIRIHNTNNLSLKLAVVIKPPVKTKTMLTSAETNQEIYGPEIRETHLEEIITALAEKYPKLHGRVVEIISDKSAGMDAREDARERFGEGSAEFEAAVQAQRLHLEEFDLNNYFFSKFYDAMTETAEELEISVGLGSLCS